MGCHGRPVDWQDDDLKDEILRVKADLNLFKSEALHTRSEAQRYFSSESLFACVKSIYGL